MKITNLYEIRDNALKSGRAVYSVQQFANLIQKPKAIAKVYLSRLVKKGLAKRLLRGKISFIEDDHVIASQLVEPSYISLLSALLFHGMVEQVPANLECVTPKNSIRYRHLGLVYHKIPASLLYGYKKYKKGMSYAFVADPEKAVIDGVYLNLMSKNTIAHIVNKIDKKRLMNYLNRFHARGKKKLEAYLL